ncbi:MAG TPA: glycosyltransferase family 4 protein [Anaerolineales bacterium]|nr:glycosyltransferase family 4 protein [Anaerolineales bacterium]
MKLGFIIYGSLDTVSGGYLYDRKLAEHLRANGDIVEIISLPWRNYAAHLTDNFHFRLPPDFDLIIQDELNHPSLLRANKPPHPCPVISLVHHLRCSELRPKWQNDCYQFVEKKYLESVDGFIFNSKTTEKAVNELIRDNKQSVVAYPPTDRLGDGIDESEIIERAMSDEFRIIFLGNVIFRKGLHTLLKAVKGLDLNIHVDVIGGTASEPHYAQEMKAYVQTHNLNSRITFHSSLDNGPLIKKLRNAHLMVVPSSYEGFGIVYLEGMSFGLPAIGTTAGAAIEIITHGKNGYLIEPDDVKTLADHITKLATDRDLLLRLSINAVQRYKIQPKWDETAKEIQEFLHRLVGARLSRSMLDGKPPPLP